MKTALKQETIKAAIYVRVSTDEQAQYGYSIEAQKEKLLAFCKSQDWEVYKTYVDDGFRATTLNRPEIQKLIEESNSGKFNMVVFYKLDRLSRSVKDLSYLIETFEKNNTAIKSITEPFDTSSPPGKLMFNMLGSFAQFERELIGERTRLGVGRRVREGKWTTSPPFGYSMINGELVINEKDVPFYKRIVELCLYHNFGTKLIAMKLNEEDKITKRAGKWSDSTIWRILTNPVYYGMVRWHDEIYQGKHEPIIAKEEFETIQKRLREKNRTPERSHSSPNILNGLIACGLCNSNLTPSKGKKIYRYYSCLGRQKGCSLHYIRTDKLHDAILAQINEIGENPRIIQDCIEEHNKSQFSRLSKLEKELLCAKREIIELNKKKERKTEWLSENLPDKNVASIIGEEIQQATKQIEELKKRLPESRKRLKKRISAGLSRKL